MNKIKCVKTGITYNLIKDTSLITDIDSKNICKYYIRPCDCRFIDNAGGYHWKFNEKKN